MTPSLKDQQSKDVQSKERPKNFSMAGRLNVPNFENKRNTPYFNQISFEKENPNIQKNFMGNQKHMLKDLISTERSRRSGNNPGTMDIEHGMQIQQNALLQSEFTDLLAPRNTMLPNSNNYSSKLNPNQETKLYESNNTYKYQNSSSQNQMNLNQEINNLERGERPNRETDLMEMDFELEPDSEDEEESKEKTFSESSESESVEVESIQEEEEKEEIQKKTPESKAVSEVQHQNTYKAPQFKVPAKSDGNATLGQRSFITSSKSLMPS
jgi:hypothetical protein